MLKLFKVSGQSMHPKLAEGDFVLASMCFYRLRIDDVVVVSHPLYHTLIKRIQHIDAEKGILLTGENLLSVSSEQMGWINERSIIGKVIYSIKRP